jgi:3',5'-nucleoside bisphosphate phosphatase
MEKDALFIGDLHVHSRFSDGDQSPKYLLELAKNRGLSFLAFTDHNDSRAYPVAKRILDRNGSGGIILLTGAELNTV